MAFVTDETRQLVVNTNRPGNAHWTRAYKIGDTVPVSGIYRCDGCGHEVTSNHPDPFPPQNKHQHPDRSEVIWRLVVMTQTK